MNVKLENVYTDEVSFILLNNKDLVIPNGVYSFDPRSETLTSYTVRGKLVKIQLLTNTSRTGSSLNNVQFSSFQIKSTG